MRKNVKDRINLLENETKTVKSTIRFKPTVFEMLAVIGKGNKAGKLEEMIIKEYKLMEGVE